MKVRGDPLELLDGVHGQTAVERFRHHRTPLELVTKLRREDDPALRVEGVIELPQEHGLHTFELPVWGFPSPFHHQAPPYDTIHHSVNPLLPHVEHAPQELEPPGGAVSIWFGRSRVQERPGDSDERSVTDKGSSARLEGPGSTDSPMPMDQTPTPPMANPPAVPPTNTPKSNAPTTRAIDALRAATDAAGSQLAQPSPDEVAQIGRLHEAVKTAERRARRTFATPGARRKLQYAIAAENAALQLHGFSTYEAFAAHYEPPPGDDETDETIARIRVLLTELGVDPQDDPVQAASVFSQRTKTRTLPKLPQQLLTKTRLPRRRRQPRSQARRSQARSHNRNRSTNKPSALSSTSRSRARSPALRPKLHSRPNRSWKKSRNRPRKPSRNSRPNRR